MHCVLARPGKFCLMVDHFGSYSILDRRADHTRRALSPRLQQAGQDRLTSLMNLSEAAPTDTVADWIFQPLHPICSGS
jgi:hypothetical protein